MRVKRDNQGIAHPLFIMLTVVVLAAIGFAGYKVYNNKHANKNGSVVGSTGTVTNAALSATEKSCNNALHDKTLCKFAAHVKQLSTYEATFTTIDSNGTTTTVMGVDGHNNTKIVITKGDAETMATILLNGVTYIKDEGTGTWIRYPKSTNSSSSSSSSNPASSIKIDAGNWTENGTTSYKALGKEGCGNLTCYKYQVVDTKNAGTTQYVWFDNKDYVMRRFASSGSSSGNIDMTLNYKTITITVPSPVTDFSAENSAAAASAAAAATGLSQ